MTFFKRLPSILLLAVALIASPAVQADDYLYYTCTKETETALLDEVFGLTVEPGNTITLQDSNDFFTGGYLDEANSTEHTARFQGFQALSQEPSERNFALLQRKLLNSGTKSGKMMLVVYPYAGSASYENVMYDCVEFVVSP